jgi:hypothetical protein
MENKPFVEQYLRQLQPGVWHEIRDLPRVIGMPGITDAARTQVLKPEFEIIIGRLYSTFKIVRTQPEAMRIIDRIKKAV